MSTRLLLTVITALLTVMPYIGKTAALVGDRSAPFTNSDSPTVGNIEDYSGDDDQESEYIDDFELADTLTDAEKRYRDPEFLKSEYKRGRMAFLFGQYDTARKIIQPLAEHGYSKAQATIGWMYHTGKGMAKDLPKAFEWYAKAAEQDHPVAENNIGVFYEQGLSVGKSVKKAAKWYRESAEWGYPYAQYNLGILYQEGRGVKKDLNEAQFWLQIAALQGVDQAVTALQKLSSKAHGRGKSVAANQTASGKGPIWLRHGKENKSGNSPHNSPHGSSSYNALVNRIRTSHSGAQISDLGDPFSTSARRPAAAKPARDNATKTNPPQNDPRTLKSSQQTAEQDTQTRREIPQNTLPGKSKTDVASRNKSKSSPKLSKKENGKDWKAGPQFALWLSDAQAAQQRLKQLKLEKKTNSHSLEIFNDDWVSEQNPKHFTIQLARSDKLDWLLQMAKKQPMLKETAYYTTLIDGKKWYYLIYGNFSDRKSANGEIANLPKAVKRWSPWVRQFSALHTKMLVNQSNNNSD